MRYPVRSESFNGAASVRTRKSSLKTAEQKGRKRFNGAASVRTRKSRISGTASTASSRFNGAASVRTRKYNKGRLFESTNV